MPSTTSPKTPTPTPTTSSSNKILPNPPITEGLHSEGEFDSPEGVALDASGNVFVADTYNDRVQKFDSSGKFLGKWGKWGDRDGEFCSPEGIAVDSSGNVFVVDSGNCRIQKFDSSGKFLAKWGSVGEGEVEFYEPCGIAVDSAGNVYVADTVNDRIQKFRRAPNIRITGSADSPLVECDSEGGRNYKLWLSADLLDWISAGGIQWRHRRHINIWMDDGVHTLGPPHKAGCRFSPGSKHCNSRLRRVWLSLGGIALVCSADRGDGRRGSHKGQGRSARWCLGLCCGMGMPRRGRDSAPDMRRRPKARVRRRLSGGFACRRPGDEPAQGRARLPAVRSRQTTG